METGARRPCWTTTAWRGFEEAVRAGYSALAVSTNSCQNSFAFW